MDTSEFCALTENALKKVLSGRTIDSLMVPTDNGRRRAQRWPFPGTVELWIPDEDGVEQHTLATSLNLSVHGIGLRTDDTELAIAIHEPEVSFHGRAIVRHCTELEEGYYVGMQFKFPDS